MHMLSVALKCHIKQASQSTEEFLQDTSLAKDHLQFSEKC